MGGVNSDDSSNSISILNFCYYSSSSFDGIIDISEYDNLDQGSVIVEQYLPQLKKDS